MVTGKATLSLAHLEEQGMQIMCNLDGKPPMPNCSLDLNLNLYPWLDSLLIIA